MADTLPQWQASEDPIVARMQLLWEHALLHLDESPDLSRHYMYAHPTP